MKCDVKGNGGGRLNKMDDIAMLYCTEKCIRAVLTEA